MTTSVSWPSDNLPLPSIAGYALKPQPNVDRSDMDSGPARQRRRGTQTPTEIPVQFELTLTELMIFESWYRYVALEGAAWFNITLLGGIGLVSHEARFKSSDPYQAVPHNGENWMVTSVLEVRDRPMLDGEMLDVALDSDLTALLAAIASFHTLVHSTLP